VKQFRLLVVLIILFLSLTAGCSKTEMYREDIPMPPNAKLISEQEEETVFKTVVSLTSFRSYYKSKMPQYGWELVRDGSFHLTFKNGKEKVLITYSFPPPPSPEYKVNITHGAINAFNLKNPPVLIKYIFQNI